MSAAATPAASIVNALSVDVEEWFQVGAFERVIDRSDWPRLQSRVERNTDAVLELFAEKRVRATFFTLGWVAERHPAVIRRIVAAGHELASHGDAHERVSGMTPAIFRADLRRSRAALEQAGGVPVHGYRAPSFSIGRDNAWALRCLAEEGYLYSSSVAPVRTDHYGWPDAPRFAHRPVPGSPLVELPVTTVRLLGRNWPAAGGGYFRLLPYRLSRAAMRRVNERDRQPVVFYFHPWEIDPDQPRVAQAPLRSRIRHYSKLETMRDKLVRLLDDFRWDRLDRVLNLELPAKAAA